MQLKPSKLLANQIATIIFDFNVPLASGEYPLSVGVTNIGNGIGTFEEYLLFIQDIQLLKVIPNSQAILYSGIFNMNPKVIIQYSP